MTKIAILISLLIASSATAQHAAHTGGISETGQAQFATIAEIVNLLRDEPDTDWETVDISALRAHLLDMNNVTMASAVVATRQEQTITFDVSGNAEVAQSITRMVTAHAPMLAAATGWQVDVATTQTGATLTISAQTDGEFATIEGLGFFGVMTIGAHHQSHHLAIAKGATPH
jgi:hypothetical protein